MRNDIWCIRMLESMLLVLSPARLMPVSMQLVLPLACAFLSLARPRSRCILLDLEDEHHFAIAGKPKSLIFQQHSVLVVACTSLRGQTHDLHSAQAQECIIACVLITRKISILGERICHILPRNLRLRASHEHNLPSGASRDIMRERACASASST